MNKKKLGRKLRKERRGKKKRERERDRKGVRKAGRKKKKREQKVHGLSLGLEPRTTGPASPARHSVAATEWQVTG